MNLNERNNWSIVRDEIQKSDFFDDALRWARKNPNALTEFTESIVEKRKYRVSRSMSEWEESIEQKVNKREKSESKKLEGMKLEYEKKKSEKKEVELQYELLKESITNNSVGPQKNMLLAFCSKLKKDSFSLSSQEPLVFQLEEDVTKEFEAHPEHSKPKEELYKEFIELEEYKTFVELFEQYQYWTIENDIETLERDITMIEEDWLHKLWNIETIQKDTPLQQRRLEQQLNHEVAAGLLDDNTTYDKVGSLWAKKEKRLEEFVQKEVITSSDLDLDYFEKAAWSMKRKERRDAINILIEAIESAPYDWDEPADTLGMNVRRYLEEFLSDEISLQKSAWDKPWQYWFNKASINTFLNDFWTKRRWLRDTMNEDADNLLNKMREHVYMRPGKREEVEEKMKEIWDDDHYWKEMNLEELKSRIWILYTYAPKRDKVVMYNYICDKGLKEYIDWIIFNEKKKNWKNRQTKITFNTWKRPKIWEKLYSTSRPEDKQEETRKEFFKAQEENWSTTASSPLFS